MEVRKKTPEKINEQFVRIMDYYFRKTDNSNDGERLRVYYKIKELQETEWKYIENIYKLAGVDMSKNAEESNRVWLNFAATKEQYTNN